MATNKTVKFAPPKQGWVTLDAFAEDTPVAEKPDFSLYHLVLYTTTALTNDFSLYSLYAHESRTKDDIENRIIAYRTFVDDQLAGEQITGFMLKVFRIDPMVSNMSMECVTNYKKFNTPKDKVFLNGPLKSNEFLSKKGKHYA